MKTVTVGTIKQLKAALTDAGLTPTPLPTLPVEVGDLRIECAHSQYSMPSNAGKGLTSWYEVCRLCGAQRQAYYSRQGLEHSSWQ
jgi:hypothetical protein